MFNRHALQRDQLNESRVKTEGEVKKLFGYQLILLRWDREQSF